MGRVAGHCNHPPRDGQRLRIQVNIGPTQPQVSPSAGGLCRSPDGWAGGSPCCCTIEESLRLLDGEDAQLRLGTAWWRDAFHDVPVEHVPLDGLPERLEEEPMVVQHRLCR